jgi:hypothetical protein
MQAVQHKHVAHIAQMYGDNETDDIITLETRVNSMYDNLMHHTGAALWPNIPFNL